ncbi:MAG: hypothetical protein MUO23_08645 [Anaerolineales bacterium]|nr:hypothetical protein [Anaerolineales bacterium]
MGRASLAAESVWLWALAGALALAGLVAGCKVSPEGAPPPQSASAEAAAEEALVTFFARLHDGQFAEAADWFGGSYEPLWQMNPGIPPDNVVDLWEAACTRNGFQCLPTLAVKAEPGTAPGGFAFAVQFAADDGSAFTIGPCCGQGGQLPRSVFRFVVAADDSGQYKVMDLPVNSP